MHESLPGFTYTIHDFRHSFIHAMVPGLNHHGHFQVLLHVLVVIVVVAVVLVLLLLLLLLLVLNGQ